MITQERCLQYETTDSIREKQKIESEILDRFLEIIQIYCEIEGIRFNKDKFVFEGDDCLIDIWGSTVIGIRGFRTVPGQKCPKREMELDNIPLNRFCNPDLKNIIIEEIKKEKEKENNKKLRRQRYMVKRKQIKKELKLYEKQLKEKYRIK